MKNKSTFIFITVILSVLVVYALLTNVLLPVITKNPIEVATPSIKEDQKKAAKKKAEAVEKEEPLPDSLKTGSRHQARAKLLELTKAEKFLQSKLRLVNDDSMYLVLNLDKKIAVLELKGVPIHVTPVLKFKVSSTIKNQQAENLLNWMAEPFILKNDSATIPKFQFIEKIAPKDTTEANQEVATTEPPKRGDVYIVMNFERNLRLVIRQDEKPDQEGRKNITRLRRKYMKEEIVSSLSALVNFNRELAMPTIEIVLPKTDATILYRALPYKPKLILYL